MNNKLLLILAVSLLTGPLAADADPVQSSTSVFLTFRHCVSGETVCDSIAPVEAGSYGGLPGEPAAITSHADPTYGEASGSAQLTGAPGAAEMSASVSSLPDTRNGGNSFILQRYTNTGASAETLTFGGTLTYDQTVPAENAGFPADGGAHTGAVVELGIFTSNVDSLEAGTTAEENNAALMSDPDPGIEITELEFVSTGPVSNVTGTGTTELSTTVTVNPGESIWLWVALQNFAANGAVANASLDTHLESTTVEKPSQ